MRKTAKVCLSCGLAAASLVTVILVSCGGSGGGGGATTAPTVQPPKINQFLATPADIAPGDSLKLTYSVTGADSTVLAPPHQVLTPPSAGSEYVKPSHPVRYVLLAYNKAGRDSVSMVIPMANSVPLISVASLDVDTIIQKDSAYLTYHVVRADSVVLTGSGKLASADSGRVTLAPLFDKSYSLIAYNSVGSDTSGFSITVEAPFALTAVNGQCYKGSLGSSTVTPTIQFRCTDDKGNVLYKPWIIFERVEGDGGLSADSLQPDSAGTATLSYTFGSSMGHAVVLALVRNSAFTYIRLRADLLTPGSIGQVEYGLIGDSAIAVKGFDGMSPVTWADQRPGYPIVYLSYASKTGVVFYVFDKNADQVAENSEEVIGGAVLAPYKGKTSMGIGIASSITELRQAYGQPHDLSLDTAGNVIEAYYNLMGVDFLLKPSDSTVEEIQFLYNATRVTMGLPRPPAAPALEQPGRPFHLMYLPPN